MNKVGSVAAAAPLLVFLRHFNDVDHITPVLAAWSEQGGAVRVFVRGELRHDFRVAYLAGLPGVEARDAGFIDQAAAATGDDRFFDRLLADCLEGLPRATVVFDHQRSPFAVGLCGAARRRGFPSVALPHGENAIFNRLATDHAADVDLRTLTPRQPDPKAAFDVFVCPNEAFAALHDDVPDDMKVVLGSARYCARWVEALRRLPGPRPDALPPHDGLKIVFFLRDQFFSFFWQEVIRTIHLLAQFPGVRIVVKHHTRDASIATRRPAPTDADIPLRHPDSSVSYVDAEASSLELLEWGDVFLSLGTSVVYDSVRRGKPVLELSYVTSFYATVARFLPTTDMRCRDHLIEWIERFVRTPKAEHGLIFYNPAEVDRFVRQMIEPAGPNVPDLYVALLADPPVRRS